MAENIVSSLSSSLKGGVNIDGLSEASRVDIAKVQLTSKAEFSKNINSAISQLFKRTQGLQVVRDGWYSLCQARLNKQISDEQYNILYKKILDTAVVLMDKEWSLNKQVSIDEKIIEVAKSKVEEEKYKSEALKAKTEALKAEMELLKLKKEYNLINIEPDN